MQIVTDSETEKEIWMKARDVKLMKAAEVRDYLVRLIEQLDAMDGEDFFGTEGWRHFIMGEDE